MKDVEFTKCVEYNPLHPKANRYGNHTFWRAELHGEAIAWGDTKAECMSYAREYIRRNKA